MLNIKILCNKIYFGGKNSSNEIAILECLKLLVLSPVPLVTQTLLECQTLTKIEKTLEDLNTKMSAHDAWSNSSKTGLL